MTCKRCNWPLYYHERKTGQEFCRQCAAVLGVERICDRGRTTWEPAFDPLKAKP